MMMGDEIVECPVESEAADCEAGACASVSSLADGPGPSLPHNDGCVVETEPAAHCAPSQASSTPGRKSTVPMFSFARPTLKDQSQGAQAQNRSHRSTVRPFFCCGSELSLVSLMEGVDLNAPGCGTACQPVVTDRKLTVSDCGERPPDPPLSHSYSCSATLGAVCGSDASIQTMCGVGKLHGDVLMRRVKSDKLKTKKRFWSLRFGKKWPSSLRFSETQKSACRECGSKKCNASRVPPCSLVCEKGKACPCRKVSYHCAKAELARRHGRVADRRASVAGIFPISGNEELLAGERSHEINSSHRAGCSIDSFIRMNNVMDDDSLNDLTSHMQQFGQRGSVADIAIRDPFEEYSPLIEIHRDFVAEDLVIHTRIDFIHHLVPDLQKITNCSFYWGVIDRYEAERLLDKKREGTFLLRDSAQDDFLFSVSFRRYNRSLHARIEQWNHRFSFDVHDPAVYSADSVCDLIEHYKDSSRCLFFEPMLTDPLHRTFPFSLQHLARAAICGQLQRYDHINKLPLPTSMKAYLRYYHYKQKVCVRRFEEVSA